MTTHNIINEPEFSFDVLRIIAKDCYVLTPRDREEIRIAADQLEASYRNYAIMVEKLIESERHKQALADALMEARRLIPAPFVGIQVKSTTPFNPYMPSK